MDARTLAIELINNVISIVQNMKRTAIRKSMYKGGGDAILQLTLHRDGNQYDVYIRVPSAKIEIPLPIDVAQKLFGAPTTLEVTLRKITFHVFNGNSSEIEFDIPSDLRERLRSALLKVWEVAKSKYRRSKDFELYILLESILTSM